ncbi:IS66 family insertion sequence element accessory protein TnpA [Thorsellia kenyensis]|uniref:IS66 family insertion sequence element accessory protein TnpA n=1 Tax=Thorsellia kenyensis TaxID=1549888 RepID=UPI00406CBD9B
MTYLTAWRRSGLTQRQYCELHQLNWNTFKSCAAAIGIFREYFTHDHYTATDKAY